jgi:hypothetical protein
VYNLHLEVFCGVLGRARQFADVWRDVAAAPLPSGGCYAILGDLNTVRCFFALLLLPVPHCSLLLYACLVLLGVLLRLTQTPAPPPPDGQRRRAAEQALLLRRAAVAHAGNK